MPPAPSLVDAAAVESYLRGLQATIVAALESVDGARFVADAWTKEPGQALGGEGVTCILEDGDVVERGGVAFSKVNGARMPPSATQARPELAGRRFEAMGVSLVVHPRNPHAPTVHLNVRFFIARADGADDVWWFGGGMDLTPSYGYDDDAVAFHRACRDALAPFGDDLHGRFKEACDRYFFLKHRNETRGVGGIFFDDFHAFGFERSFALQRAVGDAFLTAYLPILEKRRAMPYDDDQRAWQALRRGRYVEFNLVYDRGTLFGLQSGGRTESILMSMPPRAGWRYDVRPAPGSAEALLAERYLVPRDWLAEAS
jgi:coproporphyrinogen III oxidase